MKSPLKNKELIAIIIDFYQFI